MREKLSKSTDPTSVQDVVLYADVGDAGNAVPVEGGVAVPVGIHFGSGSAVVGLIEKNGKYFLQIDTPASGSGYRAGVELSADAVSALRELIK